MNSETYNKPTVQYLRQSIYNPIGVDFKYVQFGGDGETEDFTIEMCYVPGLKYIRLTQFVAGEKTVQLAAAEDDDDTLQDERTTDVTLGDMMELQRLIMRCNLWSWAPDYTELPLPDNATRWNITFRPGPKNMPQYMADIKGAGGYPVLWSRFLDFAWKVNDVFGETVNVPGIDQYREKKLEEYWIEMRHACNFSAAEMRIQTVGDRFVLPLTASNIASEKCEAVAKIPEFGSGGMESAGIKWKLPDRANGFAVFRDSSLRFIALANNHNAAQEALERVPKEEEYIFGNESEGRVKASPLTANIAEKIAYNVISGLRHFFPSERLDGRYAYFGHQEGVAEGECEINMIGELKYMWLTCDSSCFRAAIADTANFS